MERYLVSGSHGFIGKGLVSELLRQGHKVIPLERDWGKIPEVDYIYHLASYGNMHQHDDRQEIFKANVERSFDLLEATKDISYKKFVYVSSSSVDLPVQTLYSASKKAVEELIKSYQKPIAIVRPYSVTGIGEQPQHLIPTLIEAAYSGKTIPLVVTPVHDFIDIEDLVNCLIYAKPGTLTKAGRGFSYSNYQVMEIVKQISGREINYEIVDSLREYDNTGWVSPEQHGIKSLYQSIKEMVTAYERA